MPNPSAFNAIYDALAAIQMASLRYLLPSSGSSLFDMLRGVPMCARAQAKTKTAVFKAIG